MKPEDFADSFPGKLVQIGGRGIAFVPDKLPTSIPMDGDILWAEVQAASAIGELKGEVGKLPNRASLRFPYLQREAILSSKIEGTHTTPQRLLLFEVDEGDGKPSPDTKGELEVHNYISAHQRGMKAIEDGRSISSSLLCDLHRELMDSTPEAPDGTTVRGAFRKHQSYIGAVGGISSARYVCPPPLLVPELMDDLEHFYSNRTELPVLTEIAMIHYQFEAIHPFFDGNGRIGRILISLLLSCTGLLPDPLLYLSAYLDRNKHEYVNRLWRVSTAGEWKEWILFFLKGVRDEALDAADRASRIWELRELMRSHIQNTGTSPRALTLLDRLFEKPMITVSEAELVLGVNYESARRLINKLVDLQIIREVTGYARNRIFIAPQIISFIE